MLSPLTCYRIGPTDQQRIAASARSLIELFDGCR